MRSLALAAALAFVAVLSGPAPAPAHGTHGSDVAITHPMSGPVLEGRTAGAVMQIANEGAEAVRLVGASSPAFEAVELHESIEEDGVSKMRPVDGIEIPAGDTVTLAPGGLHLMLIGAKQTFRAGDGFPLTLDFGSAGTVDLTVEVGSMSGHGSMKHGDMHHGAMTHDHADHGADHHHHGANAAD